MPLSAVSQHCRPSWHLLWAAIVSTCTTSRATSRWQASDFFADGLSARPRVEGTIARGELHDDEPLYTGKEAGILVSQIPQSVYGALYDNVPRQFNQPLDQTEPAELRRALLMRGRERFDIHCSVCHGRTGDGDGMIVRRGFRKPPSLSHRALAECAGRPLFRRRHQWLRRDAQLREPD